MGKFIIALTALFAFTDTAIALPNFNPELVVKNQFGETSQLAPVAGTNFVAAFKAATVTLTAAQVIALDGAPIQLVAAQSGKLIQVVAVEMAYIKGSAAFTISASKHLIVQYHTSAILISQVNTTGFIDHASSLTAMVLGSGAGGLSIGGQAVEINSDDTGISVGTGSTVKVTVYYNLLNVL